MNFKNFKNLYNIDYSYYHFINHSVEVCKLSKLADSNMSSQGQELGATVGGSPFIDSQASAKKSK